tara:strand:+ start:381 stop:776 length:396 start_codon:yes stop_codon:yes gene_type:complete
MARKPKFSNEAVARLVKNCMIAIPAKLICNDAELARIAKIGRSNICQGIRRNHPALYRYLMEGLSVHCNMENGDMKKVKAISNKALRVFCISHRYSPGLYNLLLLSSVEKIEDLLDTEYLKSNWEKVKDYL